MRVLVVEDHGELAATIAVGLRREGMAVDIAFDGEDALRHAADDTYDVVVLDRDLPGLHGDEVCRALVAAGARARVLMLTAADTIESASTDSASAPTTICPSRSRSPSSSRASARSDDEATPCTRRCWPAATSAWTRSSASRLAAAAGSSSARGARRARTAARCRRSTGLPRERCSHADGTSTPTAPKSSG